MDQLFYNILKTVAWILANTAQVKVSSITTEYLFAFKTFTVIQQEPVRYAKYQDCSHLAWLFRVVTILYKPIWLSKFLEIIVQKILFFSLPTIFPAACFWTYAMTAIKFSVLINHLQCVLANTFTIKCIVLMSWKSWQIKDFWLCRPSRDSSYF